MSHQLDIIPTPTGNISIVGTVDIRLGDDATDDEAAEFVNKWKSFAQLFRQVDAECKRQLLERCQSRGALTVGDIRYYAGEDKDTDCVDPAATLEALFEHCGGDFKSVADCLSANAFKPGAIRGVLPPDVFNRLFVTAVKGKVKEGKPEKKLLSANTRFLK